MAKKCYVGVGDKARQVKKINVGVSSVARNVKNGYVGVNNVARLFFTSGKPLSEYAEGDIVYLNENGSPVAFYVAKHDYESGLNGTGRTLLARKECYDLRAMHTGTTDVSFPTSQMNTWLNSTYKAMLDYAVQTAMGTTKYNCKVNTRTVKLTSSSVFILSAYEILDSIYSMNPDAIDGSVLPTDTLLQIAKYNGVAVSQWTRTNGNSTVGMNVVLTESAGVQLNVSHKEKSGCRPIFTLPSTTLFDESTHEFIA